MKGKQKCVVRLDSIYWPSAKLKYPLIDSGNSVFGDVELGDIVCVDLLWLEIFSRTLTGVNDELPENWMMTAGKMYAKV